MMQQVVKPGRALQANIKMKHRETLSVLGIYTPNDPTWNGYLWEEIQAFYKEQGNRRVPKPGIMLGDFNMVEEAIDQMPPHEDRQTATEHLAELKTYLGLHDSWRQLNQTEKAYTFHQKATDSQLRIDRIYMNEQMSKHSREWKIQPSGILLRDD